jgi:hypothetical protein
MVIRVVVVFATDAPTGAGRPAHQDGTRTERHSTQEGVIYFAPEVITRQSSSGFVCGMAKSIERAGGTRAYAELRADRTAAARAGRSPRWAGRLLTVFTAALFTARCRILILIYPFGVAWRLGESLVTNGAQAPGLSRC